MARSIDNSEDIIDSRDVIAYIEELQDNIESVNDDIEELISDSATHEANIEALEYEIEELNEGDFEDVADMIAEREEEIGTLKISIDDITEEIDDKRDEVEEMEGELAPIKSMADEAEGYAPDWNYGEALIRDSYFEDYARDLACDIGAVDVNADWPACHIDWEAAADALKMDYTCIDFDGEDYWIRS